MISTWNLYLLSGFRYVVFGFRVYCGDFGGLEFCSRILQFVCFGVCVHWILQVTVVFEFLGGYMVVGFVDGCFGFALCLSLDLWVWPQVAEFCFLVWFDFCCLRLWVGWLVLGFREAWGLLVIGLRCCLYTWLICWFWMPWTGVGCFAWLDLLMGFVLWCCGFGVFVDLTLWFGLTCLLAGCGVCL